MLVEVPKTHGLVGEVPDFDQTPKPVAEVTPVENPNPEHESGKAGVAAQEETPELQYARYIYDLRNHYFPGVQTGFFLTPARWHMAYLDLPHHAAFLEIQRYYIALGC